MAVQCVVWELIRDDGGFSPYSPEISALIEAEYSRGSLSATLSTNHTLNLSKMSQYSAVTGHERAIRRTLLMLPLAPAIGAYWIWNERRGSDVLYSIDASIDIEAAHLRGDTSVNLACSPCGLPYTIDFTTMVQIRHGYNTQRKVQRCPLTSGTSLQSYLQLHAAGSVPASIIPPQVVAAASYINSAGSLPPVGSNVPFPMHASGYGLRTRKAKTASSAMPPSSSVVTGSSGYVGNCTNFTLGYSPPSVKSKRTRKKKSSGASKDGASTSSSGDSDLTPYATKVSSLNPSDDGPCPICMNQLSEKSGFEEEDTPLPPVPLAPPLNVYKLRRCEHMLHQPCLRMYMKSSDSSGFQCPTCKKMYGVKTGDMPDGQMTVRPQPNSLPGHEGYGTIEITYSFTPGTYNGRRYRTNGFPRTCYLPNSPKGQKVLKLLRTAWERRLTFTIGTSVTTGASDTVVWNEIHHKTESQSNYSGHGYPDPNYLDNILMELAAQGVEEDDGEQPLADDPFGLSSDSESL